MSTGVTAIGTNGAPAIVLDCGRARSLMFWAADSMWQAKKAILFILDILRSMATALGPDRKYTFQNY